MPFVPTPDRLKLLYVCDQYVSLEDAIGIHNFARVEDRACM
jgi:hypothetical protein